MESQKKPSFGWVQNRLPWIVAAAAFLLYLITLNHWVRLESVGLVARLGGWEQAPNLSAPLLFLLTLPVRALPASLQPIVLNALTALGAALALGLLARSVSLLPFDRTRESRQRERSEFSLLSLRLAWVPVLLAVLLCGLQLSFWEHATAVTGEVLDLLVFAYLIRCLLEYRLDRRDRWLIQLAFVYGLSLANNYAMIPFFPCFLVAVIWVKSWEFLRGGFLVRMLLAGCAGLLLYAVLPLAGTLADRTGMGALQHLRTMLSIQRSALGALPPYVILLLSFTSVVPALLMGIRWASVATDTSAAGAAVTGLLLRAVQAVLLLACLSVFFDPKWSGRSLGFGFALLPLYYLAALSVGYFTGYFMLLATPSGRSRSQSAGRGETSGGLAGILALAVLIGTTGALAYRNYPAVAAADGRALGEMADRMIASLPPQGAYVVGDMPPDLLLVDARLRRQQGTNPHVMLQSGSLEYGAYHRELVARYPGRWTLPPNLDQLPEPLDSSILVGSMSRLVASNQVYYLNPSFGYYFEVFRLIPRGLVYQLQMLRPEPLLPAPLPADVLSANQRAWEAAAPSLERACPEPADPRMEPWYLAQAYGRALNHWAVTLQRQGDPAGAAKWFELATRINPKNPVAKANLAFNETLRKPGTKGAGTSAEPKLPAEYRNYNDLLLANGPFDEPNWTRLVGDLHAQIGHYRQALVEYSRVQALMPGATNLEIPRKNMEVMTRFQLGDVDGAEKEALATQARYPQDEAAIEALAQIYMLTGRMTNALAATDRQLKINPDNPTALLNKAGFHIQFGQFKEAIPPLDRLLAKQPESKAARLNRAIAQLQSGNLDGAQRDYEALAKILPEAAAVYFGLGEIAYRRKDNAAALAHYQIYLKYGRTNSEEYQGVKRRVEELNRGAAGR